MILQCPSCRARFIVADLLIPPAGRTVKCGKCSHQWYAMHDKPVSAPPIDFLGEDEQKADAGEEKVAAVSATTPDAQPEPMVGAAPDFGELAEIAYRESEAPTPSHARLPMIARRRLPLLPFKIAAPLLMLAWLVIALFAYFPNAHTSSGLRGLYALFGATDTSGLIFEDVTMQRETAGERTRFLILGSIANQAAEPRRLPLVRVMLKDADGEVIWGQHYAVDQEIAPGELYPFRIENVETSFAGRTASIVVDLGNSFEMIMR